MNKAKTFLEPKRNTTRKVIRITNNSVSLNKHYIDETFIERPQIRSECPGFRPCPYVGCRYNLYLDIMPNGDIKMNFFGIEPEEMRWSCALDIADESDGMMSLSRIAELNGLTREKVRFLLADAKEKMNASMGTTYGPAGED